MRERERVEGEREGDKDIKEAGRYRKRGSRGREGGEGKGKIERGERDMRENDG